MSYILAFAPSYKRGDAARLSAYTSFFTFITCYRPLPAVLHWSLQYQLITLACRRFCEFFFHFVVAAKEMLCAAHVRSWSTHGAPHVGEGLVDGAAMGMNWEAGDEQATTSLDEQGDLQRNVWIGIDGW